MLLRARCVCQSKANSTSDEGLKTRCGCCRRPTGERKEVESLPRNTATHRERKREGKHYASGLSNLLTDGSVLTTGNEMHADAFSTSVEFFDYKIIELLSQISSSGAPTSVQCFFFQLECS